MNDKGSPETGKKGWARILVATGSPLKLFALTVLVCNSVFGVAAAWMKNLDAFIPDPSGPLVLRQDSDAHFP